MLDMEGENGTALRFEWRREQLRYRVLEWVYEHTGADCSVAVTGTQVGAALMLSYEELYRVIHFLEDRGYLNYRGAGPRVCITERGIRYLQVEARNRRSIRA